MANSAKVRTGLSGLIQDHLSDRLVSKLVEIMPLMFFLLAREGSKMGGAFGLGRPKVGQLYTGMPMTKARREEVLNSDKYMPIVDTLLPAEADGKVLGMSDTMPQVSDWANNGPTKGLVRPFFKWVERADPIQVAKKEIRRTKRAARNEQKASAAVGDLWRFQTDKVLSTHLKWWNNKLWGASTVAPSNVDADVWDSPYSLHAALKDDNNYGGVDRGVAANAYWKGKYDTTHRAADLVSLIHQAQYTYEMAKYGLPVSLIICGLDLFPQFITQVDALKGQVIYDGKLPGIGEFGFTKEVLRYRNTFIVMDPNCPSKTKGDATNAMTMLNLDTWTVAVSPDANFEADDPFDLTKTDGGKDAIKSQLRSELIIGCECPSANVWWNDVG